MATNQEATGMVVYETDHGEVKLSAQIVRDYLVPSGSRVTNQEVAMFLNLCKYQGLNPFLREAYLVKYGDNAAQIVTGKEVFTQRAMKAENFAGFQAGVTVSKKDQIVQREGTMVYPGEFLLGGWAKVYLKGYTVPMFNEVSLQEYSSGKALWASKPATMIRKVALVQSLREAFPDKFKGLYSQEEISTVDASALPTEPVTMPGEAPASPGKAFEQESGREIPPDSQDAPQAPQQPSTAPAQEPYTPRPNTDYSKVILQAGKYKGKTMLEAHQENPTWLQWMIDNSNSEKMRAVCAEALKQFTAKPVQDAEPEGMEPIPEDDSDLPFSLN